MSELRTNFTIPEIQSDRRQGLNGLNLFLVLIFILVISSGYIFQEHMLWGSAVLESLIFIMTIGWIIATGQDVKKILRLRLPDLKTWGMTLCVFLAGIYLAAYGDQIFRWLLQGLGSLPETDVPKPGNFTEFVISLSVIAVLPAIAEETLFRGLVLHSYRKVFRSGTAIVISSILFAFAHLNIFNFWGPLILGMLSGWLVMVTDSMFPAIFGHFLNNALSMTFLYILPKLPGDQLVRSADILAGLPLCMIAGWVIVHFGMRFKINGEIIQGKLPFYKLFTSWSLGIIFLFYIIFVILELGAM